MHHHYFMNRYFLYPVKQTTYIKLVENNLYNDIIYNYDRYFSKIKFDNSSNGNELFMLSLTYYKGYNSYAIDSNRQIKKIETINVDVYKRSDLGL